MKKMAVSCLILFLLTNMQAQTNKNYSVKAEYLFGNIMQHTRHLERLVKGPVMGAGCCVSLSEFQIVRWTKFPGQSERWCRHEFSEQNL